MKCETVHPNIPNSILELFDIIAISAADACQSLLIFFIRLYLR